MATAEAGGGFPRAQRSNSSLASDERSLGWRSSGVAAPFFRSSFAVLRQHATELCDRRRGRSRVRSSVEGVRGLSRDDEMEWRKASGSGESRDK